MPTKEQVLEAIEAMAQALGVAAEYIWEVVMRQQLLVNGILMVFLGAVSLVIGIIGYRAFKTVRSEEPGGWGTSPSLTSNGQDVRAALSAVITVVGVIAGVIVTFVGLAHVLNPGYYALKAITGMF